MGVFREITMEFEGKDYTFAPSNKLLRKIDAELYPQTLFGMLNQLDGQQAPLPALACTLSQLLNAGGGEFSEDDVLQSLYEDVRDNEGNGIAPLVQAIAECLSLPADVPEGNAGARQSRAAGKSKLASKSIRK